MPSTQARRQPPPGASGPRVAFVSDWFAPRRGGIESHLKGLGQALIRAGAKVSAITAQPGAQGGEIEVVAVEGLRLPGADLAISPLLLRRMRRALAEVRPDVVHIHASIVAPACLAGLIAARGAGLPVVLTAHSDLAALMPLFRLAGERLRGVVLSAVSAHVAAQLAPLTDTVPVVLPNGFDAGFWMAERPPSPPDGVFRLVSAMRLERKKRPGVLVQMRAEMEQALARKVEMEIAGDGRLRTGLPDDILSPGWLDREALRGLYRGAHAFVLPSRHEAFGIAALEARAAGLPVICRAGTGLAEFIRDGEDGFLCQTDADMTRAALSLARDPALWRRISGPRPSLARFDWPNVAARHLEVYAQAGASWQSGVRAG